MLLSCGVLVVYEDSVLLAHVTGGGRRWDIPKGMPETDEDHLDAALRELEEETGIRLLPSEVMELGYTHYTKTKDLYLIRHEGYYDHNTLVCSSTFERNGIQIYEVDDFRYFKINDLERYVTPNLHDVLMKYLA
jgi:8-oxo-dGTP pyrophosphatase MutT (NUDIX family)